jgi:glutamine amidotransferase
MIVVIDYGAGNIASVINMLKKVGVKAKASSCAADIIDADKLILPGVGAFDAGMSKLQERGLVEVLNRQVLELEKPILGICLGAQMLGNSSEEGVLPGLGWINMDILRFPPRADRKVPHMGWNYVNALREHPILAGVDDSFRYYFVHSYYMAPLDPSLTLLTAEYGQTFTAGVAYKNIVGVQFHPEKSHKFGMALLRNFSEAF